MKNNIRFCLRSNRKIKNGGESLKLARNWLLRYTHTDSIEKNGKFLKKVCFISYKNLNLETCSLAASLHTEDVNIYC
jgi:hypothetical protein